MASGAPPPPPPTLAYMNASQYPTADPDAAGPGYGSGGGGPPPAPPAGAEDEWQHEGAGSAPTPPPPSFYADDYYPPMAGAQAMPAMGGGAPPPPPGAMQPQQQQQQQQFQQLQQMPPGAYMQQMMPDGMQDYAMPQMGYEDFGQPMYFDDADEQFRNPLEFQHPQDVVIKSGRDVLDAITLISSYAERLLNSEWCGAEVRDHCRAIMEHSSKIREIATEEASEADERTEIEVLLNFDKLSWNFNNQVVHAFRARAARFPHDKFLYRKHHIPSYVSRNPLPASVPSNYPCIVSMPDEQVQQVRAELYEGITYDKLMEAVMRRFTADLGGIPNPSYANPDEYILKCKGVAEYVEVARDILNVEFVRRCMRDGKNVEFVLVETPLPLPENDPELHPQSQLYDGLVDFELPVLGIDDFPDVDLAAAAWDEVEYIPLRHLDWPYRVHILGLDSLSTRSLPRADPTAQLFVRTFLFHGLTILDTSDWKSREVRWESQPRWMQWLQGRRSQPETMLSTLPRATRVAFLVYAAAYGQQPKLLGFVMQTLIDEFGQLRTGRHELALWPVLDDSFASDKDADAKLDFILRGTTRTNEGMERPATLTVEWDEYSLPVTTSVMETWKTPSMDVVGPEIPWHQLGKKMRNRLDDIIDLDPLVQISKDDMHLIWRARHHLVRSPLALPKFLHAVDWTNMDMMHESHRLLDLWAPPLTPVAALELLGARYADYRVREYAVNCLRALPDDELQLFLLQLVQCLKNEPFHDSPLARFLIERALRSPYQVGHPLFWHLKAELPSFDFAERYGLLIEEYLCHCGPHVRDLYYQQLVVNKLQKIAELIIKLKTEFKLPDNEVRREYHSELRKLNRQLFERLPQGRWQTHIDPKHEATTLIVDKCRYMSSKKIPLWLVFNNKDPTGQPIKLMFKSGDDLRQDILTLQLLRICDKIWLSEGLDMRMTPYNVISTGVNRQGEGVGFIQIVPNAMTTSAIQTHYGGALGALKVTPLSMFLNDHNQHGKYTKAVENFVHSCAGYCVATYILGIGDRHNDNIMVKKDGHLFHIDFGHFLGNFKSKFGVSRERAAFVLTPEMAYVMGGRQYKKHATFKLFNKLCCHAFNVLRRHGRLFINLFFLMISAGMPELMHEADVDYLKTMLCLEKNEREAEKTFGAEIKKSLGTTWRVVDNLIHNVKHNQG